jgi:hypothetical protein
VSVLPRDCSPGSHWVTVRESALAAYDAGLSVVPPAEDGSKKPLSSWKQYQHFRAPPAQLDAWYGPRTGLGVVCGKVSGNLEVLDFDIREVYERFVELARRSGLGDLLRRIEAGYCEDTPSGGVHWPYRCVTISGSAKLATRPKRPEEQRDPKDKIRTLIETRAEGGYIILAPSNGTVHETGGAYRLRAGGFATIPTLTPDERRELHRLAKTFHQSDGKETARQQKAATAHSGGRPGDDFNARATWADVLTDWTPVFTAQDVTYWRRPGKAIGTSATTNHGGHDLLNVFSTSTAFETTRGDRQVGYTKFAAYAVLHHGGEFAAAARALQAIGYGDDTHADHVSADRVDPQTVDLVWERLVDHNVPPTLFRRQRKIVLPIAEGIPSNFDQLFARQLKLQLAQTCAELNGAQFVEVDEDLFTELLARAVPFVRDVGRVGHKRTVPAYPSPRLVTQVMASPVCPLPLARGLIRTPSFDASGALIKEPGYHPASGIFYAPPPGFVLPAIPAAPSEDAVIDALALWDEVIRDFPFVDVAGRAHILGLALTVLARELIAGPVPMCLVSKPATGTGGTLLLQCVGWIVLGEPLPESSWSTNPEELRKYLTTLLLRGRALVNLDNITSLHSKDLLQVLSGDVREDRRLGGNELLTIPNRAVFVGSGNNVTYDEEHAGRLVVCRLDAGVENPRLRDRAFTHPALLAWVAILRDLRRHGRVLQRYFQALAAIAESKAPEAAAAAAGETFTALSSLSTTLKSSQAGAVVPPLTKLVVGSFKVRALENELKQRADAIAAEIKLQEVLFQIVGDTLRTDLRVQLNTMETGQVIAPFAADAALPSSWGTTRETFLKASASAESADAAARAAAAMQEAFTALVQNRFDHAAFNSLLDDIGEVLSIAEQLAPASGEE